MLRVAWSNLLPSFLLTFKVPEVPCFLPFLVCWPAVVCESRNKLYIGFIRLVHQEKEVSVSFPLALKVVDLLAKKQKVVKTRSLSTFNTPSHVVKR